MPLITVREDTKCSQCFKEHPGFKADCDHTLCKNYVMFTGYVCPHCLANNTGYFSVCKIGEASEKVREKYASAIKNLADR